MTEAYICDAVRSAIGRYGGSLAQVRADVSRDTDWSPRRASDTVFTLTPAAAATSTSLTRAFNGGVL